MDIEVVSLHVASRSVLYLIRYLQVNIPPSRLNEDSSQRCQPTERRRCHPSRTAATALCDPTKKFLQVRSQQICLVLAVG